MSITVVEQIFNNAKENPDKNAVIYSDNVFTYAELVRRIRHCACTLKREYDIERGAAVILGANKNIDFISNYFACHLLGLTAIPLPTDTNEKRFDLITKKAEPKLILGMHDVSLIDSTPADNDDMEFSFPSMDETADIVFTTGTTGEPKGVLLTHRNISTNAGNINTFIRNKNTDNELIFLPLSHSFGLGRLRCALSNCQSVVLLNSIMMIKQFFNLLDKYEINGFGMVPANWALIHKMSKDALGKYADKLHYIEIGSAPMPIADKQLLCELLPNTRICMHYGLTEASRCAFMEFHEDIEHLTTVGKASPNTDIRIFDENGTECPDDTEGEICVSGNGVTPGYLGIPDSKDIHFGSYFRTGDWGCKNAEGYITLKSRRKELINIGGKKVSPLEIEAMLMEIEGVTDCACIGIPAPDGIMGEAVRAYIVSDTLKEEDLKKLRSRLAGKIESYKIPVEYRLIDSIPKTSSGKVQRLMLKE